MSPNRRPHRLLCALWLVSASGCLEATATLPDSGVDSGGSSGKLRGDTGFEVHPDAMSVDSTVGDTGGPRAEAGDAKKSAEGGASIPSCKSPTTAQATCASCVEAQCASDVTAAVGACGAFYACFAGCSCNDTSCVSGCDGQIGASCKTPLGTLVTCEMSLCASQCATDAGPTGDAAAADDAGATCKDPTATQKACGMCEESMCASTVAAEKSDCASFNQCFAACDCSDTSCIDTCAESASSACETQLEALETCQTSTCKSACAGPADGGTTAKDGGASGQIPDCKNPTSTEQSTYAMCSQCDNELCGDYVTAAVGACSAYYGCVATTDCSNTVGQTDCYDDDADPACESAVTALAGCQGTFCYAPCAGF